MFYQKRRIVFMRFEMRVMLPLLCCVSCVCSAHAQKGKDISKFIKAATSSGVEKTIVKSSLPGVSAASTISRIPLGKQLSIQFPGEIVQLEIPFEKTTLPAQQHIANELEKTIAAQEQAGKALKNTVTLPSGEIARVVELEAKHFRKTNRLNATVRYFMSSTPNPAVFAHPQTGERITVFQNDRLRYFSDVQKVCPAGSYLIRYADGRVDFLAPKQASKEFVDAYEKAYERLNPSPFLDISFAQVGSSYKIPEFNTLAPFFDPAAGLSRVYRLPAHPVTGQPAEVAVITKSVQVTGLPLLNYGSMVVRFEDGTFDVHPADMVPPVLRDRINAIASKSAISVPLSVTLTESAAPSLPAGVQRTYDGQADLARDLHRALEGKGKPYSSMMLGDFLAYEIPEGIVYKPQGRDGVMLDPETRVVIYFPKADRGQIVDRHLLTDTRFATPKK